MKTKQWMAMTVTVAVVLAGMATMAMGQTNLTISSFQSGLLSWKNVNTSLYYSVEWMPVMTESNSWSDSYDGLQGVQSTSAVVTVPVPMFLRVVGDYLPVSFRRGLVGYFPLNGDGTDASAFLNNGTLSGGTTTSNRFGVAGQAMLFNAPTGYVVIADAPQYDVFSSNFTVTVFFKTTDIPTGGQNDNRIIFQKRNGWTNPRASIFIVSGGQLRVYLEGTNTSKSVTSSNVLADGMWHQVAFVRDTNLITMYVDGAAIGSSDAPSGRFDNLGAIRVGNSFDYNYNGSVDELRIYNRALSNQEITFLYQHLP